MYYPLNQENIALHLQKLIGNLHNDGYWRNTL